MQIKMTIFRKVFFGLVFESTFPIILSKTTYKTHTWTRETYRQARESRWGSPARVGQVPGEYRDYSQVVPVVCRVAASGLRGLADTRRCYSQVLPVICSLRSRGWPTLANTQKSPTEVGQLLKHSIEFPVCTSSFAYVFGQWRF